jgi:hypothetical protein
MKNTFVKSIDDRAHKAFNRVKADLLFLREEVEKLKGPNSHKLIETKLKDLENLYKELQKDNISSHSKIKVQTDELKYYNIELLSMKKEIRRLEKELDKSKQDLVNYGLKSERYYIGREEKLINRIEKIEENLFKSKEKKVEDSSNTKKKQGFLRNNNDSTSIKSGENHLVEKTTTVREGNIIEDSNNEFEKKGGFIKWILGSDKEIDSIKEVKRGVENDEY